MTRQDIVDALTAERYGHVVREWHKGGYPQPMQEPVTICAQRRRGTGARTGRIGATTQRPRRNAAARQGATTPLPGLAHPLSTEGST